MVQILVRNSTNKVAEAFQKALMDHASMRKAALNSEGIITSLIEQNDSIIFKVIKEISTNPTETKSRIISRLSEGISRLTDILDERNTHLQITVDVRLLFEAADRERKKMGDSHISTGAVFLGGFDPQISTVAKIFYDEGLLYEECKSAVEMIRGSNKIFDKEGESRKSILNEYTTDLTALAKKGGFDPVYCREEEINRVIEILSQRRKNNPLLIGEPGVGKTVIAEGLAARIMSANVPEYLLGKRILMLEIGSLIAGARMQGEFEERLKLIRDEIIASSGEIILFIDEIHTLVGAGRSSGSLDASNMLKPALANGQLQCIGATTFREFKLHIESDKALVRRFGLVKINEPTIEDSISILFGLREKYEKYHGVVYSDEAVNAAVNLSKKYMPDKFLPDKAIDLFDQAGARKRLLLVNTPKELRELENKRQDIMELKSKSFNEQDFESMAQFQMDLIKNDVEIKLMKEKFCKEMSIEDKIVKKDDLAAIVSLKTGVPIQKIVTHEAEKILSLEDKIKERVVGQDHAVRSVVNAIKRNRSGIKGDNKPIASFLFLGPTGVGKTELAKSIASEMLDDENRIIRIDMSEYMEQHSVARLIGSPPGYVGYGEGGQLTEKIRRQPYSVVLFDEFEKAHPDIFNILLQVFDEGWLTDGEGTKVNFSNCIIVCTSNLGSEILTSKRVSIGIKTQTNEWSKDELEKAIFKEVKGYFRPEFINRLDEIIVFNKLSDQQFAPILEILIQDLSDRVKVLGLNLKISDEVKRLILSSVETEIFGARPLKRKLELLVENNIADQLIRFHEKKFSEVLVALESSSISVSLR